MDDRLLVASAQTLGIAFLITLMFGAISFIPALFPGGELAVLTIGGLHQSDQMPKSMHVVFFLDSAFAVFYGAGLICLTASFSSRANRPLTRILVFAILILAICDFSENRLIMDGFDDPDGRASVTSVVTHLKYSLLALIAIGLSVLIPPSSKIHTLVAMLLRTAFPVLIAALVVYGSNGDGAAKAIGFAVSLSFVLLLLSLSWIAWQEHLKNWAK